MLNFIKGNTSNFISFIPSKTFFLAFDFISEIFYFHENFNSVDIKIENHSQ